MISEESQTLKRLKECCELISSPKATDNVTRKNTLKEIHNLIVGGEKVLSNSSPELENLTQILITTLKNDNEKCRELSGNTLIYISEQFQITEVVLPLLFNTLVCLLGKSDEREKSEEVRLIEINFLHSIIDNYNGNLLKYFNDISSILSFCIIDDCPDVKRRSCECINLLASKQKTHFHMIASNLLTPLLKIISHQHLKTRTLCVKAIGSVIEFLKEEEFDLAIRHLSQRLFDHSPQVRKAVTEVIGDMLIEFRDRYSYFPRLIPLILSSLHDDVEEIKSKAEEFWERAGEQYLKENENDYKDLIDFPVKDPEDYPVLGHRPSLGCRILIHRNIFNILPPLLNDIVDWVPETKIKSSCVLYSLILHSEEKIVSHLASALQGIESAVKSDEKKIVEQALQSAELLGYFTDPHVLFDSVLTLLYKSTSVGNIRILAACLNGRRGKMPAQCFVEICKFLAMPTVCRFRLVAEQAHLLKCVEALLFSSSSIESDTSYFIFTILVSTSGLAANDLIVEKAADLQKDLAESQSSSEALLYKLHTPQLINVLTENSDLWTPQSPEVPIFAFILNSGYIGEDQMDLLTPVLLKNLHPSKDARIRSRILTSLIPVFKSLSHSKHLEQVVLLVRSGLFPNLQWSAGKTAGALRAVAAASLLEILARNTFRKDILKSVSEELLPILTTLADEDAATIRLITCKILTVILPDLYGCVDELKIHTLGYEVLQLMDDESDDIRMMTTKVIAAYLKAFPSDYNWSRFRSHLKHVYENALIHMDDKNKEIQSSMLELLKEGAFAAPDLLLDEVESKRYQMAAGDFCDTLIDHIKSVKI